MKELQRSIAMFRTTLTLVSLTAMVSLASASNVSITITNTQTTGGFSFTPFWLGFHDNNFDTFDAGTLASSLAGITDIAEVGMTGDIAARFNTEQPNGVETTFMESNGAGVFSPGESDTIDVNVGDATVNRYLSYASMIVPSNDLFVGNDDALMLFDAGGNFVGPITINIYGRNVWDNGSEANDISDGPAFVVGIDGSLGTVESNNIQNFFSIATAPNYIDSITNNGGTNTPVGLVNQGFGPDTLLGTITITPEPSSLALLGLCTLLIGRRR